MPVLITTEVKIHTRVKGINLNVILIDHYNNNTNLCTSLLGPHLGVDGFNILPLGKSTLVTSKTPLGKFVYSFVGG